VSEYTLRRILPADRNEVARLIYHSTNAYYRGLGKGDIFQGDDLSAAVIVDVYAKIDPGQAYVAVDDNSQKIIGSCFVHPRETHVSLGILNVHPEHFGRGIASRLLKQIQKDAVAADKPVRLVSSCSNLDSFSLYSRAGFVVYALYQDMLVTIPEAGLAPVPEAVHQVRPGTIHDVAAMGDLEFKISGIKREADYRYFLTNTDGLWHVSVFPSATTGELDGFLVSSCAGDDVKIGPGVVKTEQQAAALLWNELKRYPGKTVLVLSPALYRGVLEWLYQWKARNIELHVGQVYGEMKIPKGITFPTFLPESG
jgi:ribosomal protein S18 acetylase RimI-like enzyme